MIDPDDIETLVIFRIYKPSFKCDKECKAPEILALFPEIIGDYRGNCECYQHVGQHGSADYYYVVHTMTTWAKPEEYADLKHELEQIGYKLKVRRKWMRNVNYE